MYAKCILLLLLCLLLTSSLTARMRNGYAPELSIARECLQLLSQRLLFEPDMSERERRKIHTAIKKHADVIAMYELTQSLLLQFKAVSPKMYALMDALEDKRGRETDVYVRFVPEQKSPMKLSGTSFFRVSPTDTDASQSRFGKFTVAIDIWICDTSLNILAHELGHTSYIVPNLAAYLSYYGNIYRSPLTATHVGHSPTDASGRMAYSFGQQYLRDRRAYKSSMGTLPRVATVMKDVKRTIYESVESRFNDLIASSVSYE
ncbi:hypothetical protein WBG78_16470 [Chryseolinea sp. T2]|uniref:hypothetical protein n=1 Tax=Chryseolinea sp. T2 TaxID=3129255 RepID=UPI0030771AB4